MAQGNKSSSSSSENDIDSDDELPSYEQLVQENLKYTKSCTSQQKKLNLLKKLDSSQEAYNALLEQYETFANLNVELSTKIKQLEASANKKECTINDEQRLVHVVVARPVWCLAPPYLVTTQRRGSRPQWLVLTWGYKYLP
jgi:septal ring factor EnvC (AmiA/AmiB activator)